MKQETTFDRKFSRLWRPASVLAATALTALVSTPRTFGSTFVPTSGTTNTWNSVNNWTNPATIPNAVDAVAIFNAPTAAESVQLGVSETIGSLTVHDNSAFALSLANTSGLTLTFSTSSGNAAALVDGSGTVVTSVASALVLTSTLDVTVSNITVTSSSGAITFTGSMTGAGGYIKDGDGTSSMTTATKAYTGATTVNAGVLRMSVSGEANGTSGVTVNSGGQLRLDSSGTFQIGSSASTSVTLNGAGDANLTGTAGMGALAGYTTSTLSNAVSLASASTIFTSGTTTLTLSGVVSGPGALTKTGGATSILALTNANNSYSGGTTVVAGALYANAGVVGTSSATGTGAVTVSGGTLGGTGSISGPVTVASGATLQGGAGTTAGTLTLATSPTLNAGSILQMALDGSLNHSTLALPAGSNPFNSNQAFNFTGTPVNGTYDNIITGVAPGINTSGWTINNGFNAYTFIDDGSNIDLMITDVPEPATLLGAVLLIGALGWNQRRRLGGLAGSLFSVRTA